MRILIDTSSITRKRTGTGTYAEGMLRSLVNIPTVDNVIAVGGEVDMGFLKNPEKVIHLYPGNTRWHYLLNNIWTGNRFNWNADIAFFPNYFMPFAFPIRSIVTIHDVSFLSHPECYRKRMRVWYTQRIKQTVGHADLILTVSESSQQNIIHYLGVSENRIKVIKPGNSLSGGASERDNPVSDNHKKNFLYIGTIEPRKNIINMLRGFIETESPDFQLQLAGQVNCGRTYWNAVKSLISSDKRIQYLGYLPDEQLKKVLFNSDVLVNLSIIEGFGIPVMEALLKGKKCLISNDSSLKQLAGEYGIIVHGDQIGEIAGGFKNLGNRIDPIPGKAIKNLSDYYSWERFTRQLTPLIENDPQKFYSGRIIKDQTLLPDIEKAIVEGLSYGAVFKCPLTHVQLYERLPGMKCTFSEFNISLNNLCEEFPELFETDRTYIYLKPFDNGKLKRDSDLHDNAVFIKKHKNIIRYLYKLPWIKGVYYSGGTVHGSHLLKKDLDLFIVSSKNRAWLLYTLLKCFALMVHRKSVLCFNYLVDESALTIHYQRDFYTAHQLACLRQALPGKNMPEPLKFNQWVFDFFPNLEKTSERYGIKSDTTSHFGYWMNMLAMGLWTGLWNHKGLKNRQGGLLWDFHRIKLHTHDHRPFVYEKYRTLASDVFQKILTGKTINTGYRDHIITGEPELKHREISL